MVQNDNIEQKLRDLKSGKLSCEQNVNDFLAEIEKNDEKLNIFLQINKNAIKKAIELDKKRENKEKLGALYGLCFSIKSNISIKDMNISCASKTLESYSGTYNADVIEKILSQDGIILGIVNNDEFASGASGETSAFGITQNPFSLGRVAGGSSSGSAASVAANMCDISLGSDTGGSIRNPASHCGIIGIKPSYGRVSRYGLVDLSMSLDQIGPLSKDLYGSELVLNVISGYSPNDSISTREEVLDYTNVKLKSKYKIGIIKSFNDLITNTQIKDVFNKNIEKLKLAGHEIIELDIKNVNLAIQAYYPIVYTEFFSGTRKFDSVKYGEKIEESAGEEVRRRIIGGEEISKSEFEGAFYKKALKVKSIMVKEFSKAFKEVDFIISPVTPTIPHKIGSNLTPEEMYSYDAFSSPSNLAGICAGVISKDSILVENETISIGMQVMANKFREDLMFEGLTLIESLHK